MTVECHSEERSDQESALDAAVQLAAQTISSFVRIS
jgi:hypothetical protein